MMLGRNMSAKLALLVASVSAIWAHVRLFPRVGPDVHAQGVAARAAVRAEHAVVGPLPALIDLSGGEVVGQLGAADSAVLQEALQQLLLVLQSRVGGLRAIEGDLFLPTTKSA